MSEQELREKIARIIAKRLCKNKYSHFQLYGDSANCYSRENFAECEVITDTVDALISAGIGDVRELKKHRTQIMKDGTIQQLYSGEEVEQIVKERDEYKHRAEVAEDELARHKLALRIAGDKFINEVCNMRAEDISDKCDYKCDTCFYDYYLQQAEKELQEERKDE